VSTAPALSDALSDARCVLEALVARYWSPTYSETVLFIAVFLVLLVRPHGLFSRLAVEKD